MFGIGMTELMVIFVIGLVVLGPKRLPEMARSMGKSLAEFRRASNDMRREFMAVSDEVRIDPHALDSPPAAEPEKPAVTGTASVEADTGKTPTAGTETGKTPNAGAVGTKAPEPRDDG